MGWILDIKNVLDEEASLLTENFSKYIQVRNIENILNKDLGPWLVLRRTVTKSSPLVHSFKRFSSSTVIDKQPIPNSCHLGIFMTNLTINDIVDELVNFPALVFVELL